MNLALANLISWRWAAIKIGIIDAMAYRLEFLLSLLGELFVPAFMQWVFWNALFRDGSTTEVAGMGYSALIQYTLTSMLFSQIRGGNLDFEISEMIRVGSLSNFLLRPIGVLQFIYLRGLGPKLLILAACFGIGGAVAAATGGFEIQKLIYGMLMAFLGNLIHFQISATLALLAFYWEDAWAVLVAKNLVMSFLSGEMLPLSFFPPDYAWIWKSLPFYLFVYGPTQVTLGHWEGQEILFHFGVGFFWLVATATTLHFFWKRGIHHYQSAGG